MTPDGSIWNPESRVSSIQIQKMIKIKLNSGREVSVEGFSFGYTYGGLYEGLPNEKMNNDIFDRSSYPNNWGPRKVLKIRPPKSDFEKALKPTDYAAWLHSNEPIDPEYHGSELVVIWFGDPPNGKTVEEIIEQGIKDIDWESNAEDFFY